ncbi:MAG: NAD(P)-dependent oxidoreductase, partial [Peptococcaceae bacterium]|nr:NAD(P)-dependent oxidoreductase [Peptococcaceae bacterium]
MAYYHITVNLAGELCLVVGGGRVAERKVRTLL